MEEKFQDLSSDTKILLIEDSEDDAELAFRVFRKHRLAEKLLWVKNSEEALNIITGAKHQKPSCQPIKLILLDVNLPKIGGLQLLKIIRSNPSTKTVPIVMLTSSREESDIVESYRLGVNSYISKPVCFSEFENSILSIINYWLSLNQQPMAC